MYSIPQQLVAKVSGHNELDLAQLIKSSSLLSIIPPPAVSCTWPGKILPPTPEGEEPPTPKGEFEEPGIIEVIIHFKASYVNNSVN